MHQQIIKVKKKNTAAIKSAMKKIGWREWCALPDLQIPIVKAKIDTGARTSALHAFNIKPLIERGAPHVEFHVNPLQRNRAINITCIAPIVDQRAVTNSGGISQQRYVIMTNLKFGDQQWEIELTLTNRDAMGFRMLLGREALRRRVLIDPASSFTQGRLTTQQIQSVYMNPPNFFY
jgi:ribosomal protein S6--L-glutamate ligase